ncbi:MerR family transcriptional regulator [Bacillus litorisediminis]|uniref:MerR family transcriptional regulator n=1 Tax=Bacillus litorisediminis TaxID=2922713 RepID=UPI001FAF23EF|nr:MerR family transcriptional regulator [Bacillus litorisediminis]
MVKPIEIAKKLGISTSALRHYESWGIVPKAERKTNGYRVYTEEHVAYFECIRAMNSGFGMKLIRDIMPMLQKKQVIDALWKVNAIQAQLNKDKQKAEKALAILEQDSFDEMMSPQQSKQWYTIGEAAELIDVVPSTLRHWEQEDLIEPERDRTSGYRMYTKNDLRKLLVIRTLQKAVYSLEVVREILGEMDKHNLEEAIKITRESLVYLDYLVKEQLKGMAYLYRLCQIVEEK